MAAKHSPILPGRLGTPNLIMRDDPRLDPRIAAALAPFELDGAAPPSPVPMDAPREAKLEFCAGAEPGYEGLFVALFANVAAKEGVESMTETITGVAGNEIKLFIHKPAGTTGPVPGILHLHGGGMAILSAAGPMYACWREAMAATGMVVIGVEFRNAAGALGRILSRPGSTIAVVHCSG